MLSIRNKLLLAVGETGREVLLPHLESCEVLRGQRLDERKKPIDRIYFPETGIASVIAIGPQGYRIEVGPFGREGMSGISVLLRTRSSPFETVVQIGGIARWVRVEALEWALDRNRSLHRVLLRYVQAFMIQASDTLLVNSYAVVEQRLARWLLMAQDRAEGDGIAITHEYISEMLAVRRPGVTEAIQMIEGRGLIRATRGLITVRDRTGLERLAGPAYGLSEAEYRRLLDGNEGDPHC